jgi:hypothetical protein
MDKQRVEDVVTDTAAEVGATVQGKLDQGKGVFQDLQAGAGEVMEKTNVLVREVSTAGSQAVVQAGEAAQVSLARYETRPVKLRQPSISTTPEPEGI